MNYKDNIEWLKSLKQQIGQTQHRDLWHFEQVIDETIENLNPLAKPHGRLIDADAHIKLLKENHCGERCRRNHNCFSCGIDMYIRIVENEPTVIKAEGVNE